tara:strand:- start:1671 stop:3284 length:1614 start_codon:yes stop_codon:yes gene_type:complete
MAQEQYDPNLLEAALASSKILEGTHDADSQDAVERAENLTDAVFKLMGEAVHQDAEKEDEEETDSKDEAVHSEEEEKEAEESEVKTPGQTEAYHKEEEDEEETDSEDEPVKAEAYHSEEEEDDMEVVEPEEAMHSEEEEPLSPEAITPGQGEVAEMDMDKEDEEDEKETLSEPGYMKSDMEDEEDEEGMHSKGMHSEDMDKEDEEDEEVSEAMDMEDEEDEEEVAEEAPAMGPADEEDGVEGSADATDGIEASVSKISKAMTAAATEEAMGKINAAYGSMKEDIEALCAADESLTEEFKTKAATIFEAAVTSKAREHVENITEAYKDSVEEQISALHEDLIEKIDSYMTYVAEEWIAKNEIAVTNSLRSEIAESFMANLKDTFSEHYIEMPEGKTDMFDEISQQNSELSEQVTAQKDENLKLRKQLVKFSRKQVVQEASEGLAATQAAKLASLVEDISFESTSKFKKKVSAIKEAYFSSKKVEGKPQSSIQESNSRTHVKTVIEDVEPQVEEKLDPTMAAYIKASTKLTEEAYGINN